MRLHFITLAALFLFSNQTFAQVPPAFMKCYETMAQGDRITKRRYSAYAGTFANAFYVQADGKIVVNDASVKSNCFTKYQAELGLRLESGFGKNCALSNVKAGIQLNVLQGKPQRFEVIEDHIENFPGTPGIAPDAPVKMHIHKYEFAFDSDGTCKPSAVVKIDDKGEQVIKDFNQSATGAQGTGISR